MRRGLALLLTIAVVACLSPAAGARARKRPARAVTYYMVPDGEGCMLSTNRRLSDPTKACSRSPAATTSATPNAPVEIPVGDGLPFRIDVTRPVQGIVSVRSTTLISTTGPLGAGEAQLAARLTGLAGGKEIAIGETTSDPYTVTPASAEYTIEFEIDPDAALAGVVLDELTLSLHTTGTTVRHGGFPADGSSSLTLGVAGAR
jgi:hypothetical protein